MRTYIGIGSNLGDRKKNIENAIAMLGEKCMMIRCSSLYETEPVGFNDQPWFLNCVVEIDTDIEPLVLLGFLQGIEQKLKRVRTIKNGPRTIDLDILCYGNHLINNERLIVPHPRLHERLFVLEPFNEINPAFIHPVLKQSIRDLTCRLHKEMNTFK